MHSYTYMQEIKYFIKLFNHILFGTTIASVPNQCYFFKGHRIDSLYSDLICLILFVISK